MTGTDLAPIEGGQAVTLFGSDDPEVILNRAGKAADALKKMLTKSALILKIQKREFVRVEGWTALGSMLGVFPVTEWTRRVELEDDVGWEARVKAVTRTGEVVGAAEASCMRSEHNWKNRDEYALRSMAQTRATSKALRQPLGFVVAMAGYQATPAEEIPPEEPIAIDEAMPFPIEMTATEFNQAVKAANIPTSWVARIGKELGFTGRSVARLSKAERASLYAALLQEQDSIPF
jgi:hypothetical protein